MKSLPSPAEFDRLKVVLVSPRNPLNIGAAARAMSNFGFQHMRLVNPYEVAFRDARSAVGAQSLLARAEEFPSIADAVADCTLVIGTSAVGQRGLQHPLKMLESGARLIRKRLLTGNVALLFGSEKYGLSNRDLSHCHWLLRIPTREEHISMNLGQAVAICMYELARAKKAPGQKEKTSAATAVEIERINTVLLAALQASGYVEARGADAAEEKLRRLLLRLNLPTADAELWLGMMRQILWKLNHPR